MNTQKSPEQQGDSTAILDLLPENIIRSLKSMATLSRYAAGQLIQSRGDNNPGLSIVKKGTVNIGVYGVDGVFVMASMLGEGEAYGEFTLFTHLPRTHDVSAATDVEIYQLNGARFLKLCDQEPILVKVMLRVALVRTHILLELLDAMRRLPVLERTAKLILFLAERPTVSGYIPTKQNDLALGLGVSRVTLGKVLKQLSELELIELGYRKISLPDKSKLAAWLESRSTTPLAR